MFGVRTAQIFLLGSLTCLACGPGEGMEASEDTTAEDMSACGCVDEEEDAFGVHSPTCGELLCDPITTDYDSESQSTMVNNPEAVDCGLEALRDRTPGYISWTAYGSVSSSDGYLIIYEDGTLVTRSDGYEENYFYISDAVHGEAKSPEVFSDCLADDSALARLTCLRGAIETELAICAPADGELD